MMNTLLKQRINIENSDTYTFKHLTYFQINGPKTRVLCSEVTKRRLELPNSISSATIVSTPTKVLGAIVQPDRSFHNNIATCEAVKSVCEKLDKKYKKLLSLPCTTQEKWLILSNITMHALYYVESSSIGLPQISSFIDELQLHAFKTIFSLSDLPRDCFVRLFYPIEDGGMGLFPYSEFGTIVRARMAKKAELFLQRFELRNRESYDGPITLTATLWNLWANHLRPDVYGTRDWKIQQLAKIFLRLPPHSHESFLRYPPLNTFVTFTDEQFTFAVQHRLGIIPHYPQFRCSLFKPDRETFSTHFSSCTTCASAQFHRRHNAVVMAIHKCCKYHGYDSQLVHAGTWEYARPGNSKGGADVMIYVNGKTFALDVSVVKEGVECEGYRNRLGQKFTEKISLYAKYKELHPDHTIFPFVMSIYGTFYPESIKLLTEMSRLLKTDTHFRQDILRHTQAVLLKTIHSSFCTLKAKHISTPDTPQQIVQPNIPPFAQNPHLNITS